MRRQKQSQARRGVAATEFAVILPIVVVVVFGGLSTAHLTTLKHNVRLVVNSAALEVVEREEEFSDIIADHQAMADSVGIENLSLTINRVSPILVEIEATVPVAENNPLGTGFSYRPDISTKITVYRP